MPNDLDEYFNSLLLTAQTTPSNLYDAYKKAKADDFHPINDDKLEWADGRIFSRTISSIQQAQRKIMGRKVDMVYELQQNDFGRMKCGRY